MVDRIKTLDFGRVLQITLSLVAIIALFVQGGRILERTESTKKEIIDLITHNEAQRDLKDSIKAKEMDELRKMIEGEISERKKSDERLERLRDLMMVNFGKDMNVGRDR